jgi:hypothetical protein
MTISRAIRYYVTRFVRNVLRANDSPRQIAGGVAIGTLVGFMPTMGGQMISAALIATLFRCSRIPAMAMVYITNPFTAVPIYGSCYFFGVALMKPFGFEPLEFARVRELFVRPEEVGFWGVIYEKLGKLFELGWNGLAPLWLGCMVGGVFASVIMYYVALRFVTGHRLLKAQRQAMRAKERLDRVRTRQMTARERGID